MEKYFLYPLPYRDIPCSGTIQGYGQGKYLGPKLIPIVSSTVPFSSFFTLHACCPTFFLFSFIAQSVFLRPNWPQLCHLFASSPTVLGQLEMPKSLHSSHYNVELLIIKICFSLEVSPYGTHNLGNAFHKLTSSSRPLISQVSHLPHM